MSVRKRKWKNDRGETKEAWVVDYVDQLGKRHIKTFPKKKPADAWQATVRVDVQKGIHAPDSGSITVAEAGERWIKNAQGNNLEKATLADYQRHLNLHIKPYLGNVKLPKLTAPMVNDFRTKLREGTPAPGQKTGAARSSSMVKKIVTSLSSILADALNDGYVAQNVVRGLTNRKKRKTKAEQRRKLKAGVDFPTPSEVKVMLAAAAPGRWQTFLMTATMTGLRASELRGLAWEDIDFSKAELNVRQRADRYRQIDKPKSEAGERAIPLPPMVVAALRKWKFACPPGPFNLVFPTRKGKIDSHTSMVSCGLVRAQLAAGLCIVAKDDTGAVILDAKGNPVRIVKYTGLHSLRHFFASWCINSETDGGLGLAPKVVQTRLGHSSITMTMDVYGHLFPRGDDGGRLAEAERQLIG